MADSPAVQRLLDLAKSNKLESGNDLLELSSVAMEAELDVVELGRLNWSPRKNWVERAGGLPKYIEDVAIGIMKSGRTREQAIPIAISRIKVWARGGGGVKADTVARAIKALAQWEALKAKNKVKTAAKKARK